MTDIDKDKFTTENGQKLYDISAMTYIDRNKFTTEIGRKLYDVLKPIALNENWLFAMLMLTKGDDQRQELLDYINSGERTIREINDFVISKWG